MTMDDALFNELSGTRKDFVSKVSAKHAKLKDLLKKLKKENDEIRASNEKLKQENAQLEGTTYKPPEPVSNPTRLYDSLPDDDPRKAYRQAKIIRTQEAPVHSANFSSQANLVATASWGATIHLYDLEAEDKKALVRSLGGDEADDMDNVVRMGGLYDVQFAKTLPNILAAASADNFVYLWNYHKGRLITRLSGHTDEVNSVCFHPSQQVICSTSDDATAIIWDFHEGIKLRCLEDHAKAAYGATFLGSHNPYFVATCSFDSKVRIFDMRGPSTRWTLQEHFDEVVGIDFNEEKGWLASGSDDGFMCVWDLRNTGKPQFKIDTSQASPEVPNNEVKRISFNATGTKLACGTDSQQVLVYDLTQASPEICGICSGRTPHTETIFDVCFGYYPNGQEYLVDASHDQTSFVWIPVA